MSAVIAAVSARTPVGLNAESAAAAVRGRISRIKEHSYFVTPSGDALRGAVDARLDPALQGVPRLLALLTAAYDQIVAKLPTFLWSATRVPVLLSTPEHRPGFTASDEERFIAALHRQTTQPVAIQVAGRGHAGVLHAVGIAAQWVTSGQCEVCLVGGVESYFHADTIDWLAANKQLPNDDDCRSTFFPGEGASFLAIMTPGSAARLGLPVLAKIRGTGSAMETSLIKTDAVNLGKGLTSAVGNAASGLRLPEEALDEIWCDQNGERYRSDEFSYILLRWPQVFRQPPGTAIGYKIGGDCWGDMGAATGALLTVLAVQSWQRFYARGPRALICAGSEQGLRGALVLEEGRGST